MITHFKAGGLRPDDRVTAAPRLAVPDNLATLPWYDGRMFCLEASDQRDRPSCAGYSTAGYCEVQRWANTFVKEQLDGDKCYDRAKTLDPDKGDGTTLPLAVQAAQDLGYIDKGLTIRTLKTKRDVLFALHKHRVVIAGLNITEDWNYCNMDTGWIGREHPEHIGGHAVLLCWFDDRTACPTYGIGGQNSWAKWGKQGFFRMTWGQFQKQFMYGVVLE